MGVCKEWSAHGLLCRVLDGPLKNFNGYVAVPKGHVAWGVDYDDLPIEVHGGLTFGQVGRNSDNWPDDSLWWFGFDTYHAGDYVEYTSEIKIDGRKWSLEDVIGETETMAAQFSKMAQKVFLDYEARDAIEKYYGENFLEALLDDDKEKMISILKGGV